ncbi:DNA pilot protein VP2 [Microviridae Fen4707_41]|uniref:DNA pilot protein VP2 n=1 Tax=Microviridae Fen4707_41 TaxID=1655654 RepID=UPI00063D5982|nr:DNA pilot protein VP2 [Microviridae Fen4707_41]AKI26910.1 DNA pilot protein VP2 [Microviridae Fen4707_41]
MEEALLAGGSLLSGLIQSGVQNQYNIAAVNAQNAYNAPAQQMARYTAAGLNPNLIYSQGSAGLQSAPVQFMTPEVDPVKIYSAAVAAKQARQGVEESKMRAELTHYRSLEADNIRRFNALKREAEVPYIDRNAQYQSGLLRQSLRNATLNAGTARRHQMLQEADLKLKGQQANMGALNLQSAEAIDPKVRKYLDYFFSGFRALKP